MKNTFINIGIALLFLLLLLILAAAVRTIFSKRIDLTETKPSKQQNASKPRKFIIVCEEWAPFEYLENGKPTGIDVEVLNYIFGKFKVDYEIQFYPWARAWWLAKNGKADAVISISYKKSREKYLMYTDSQKQFAVDGTWPTEFLWNAKYVFFCKKEHKEKLSFTSYPQLRADGHSLVTIREYSYNKAFRDARLPSIAVPDQYEAFRMLDEGQVDLFPNELTIGRAALKKKGLSDRITCLDKALFTKPYLMPFCQQSDYPGKADLMMRFYAELNKMRDSNEYRKIYLKYTEPLPKSPIPKP